MKEENETGWCLIPPHIIAREDISNSAKILFGRIHGLTKNKGYCYASNGWLGEQIGLDIKTVEKLIRQLKNKKLIISNVIRSEDQKVIERQIFTFLPLPSFTGGPPLQNEGTPPLQNEGYSVESSVESSLEKNSNKETATESNTDLEELLNKRKSKKQKVSWGFGRPQSKPVYETKRKGVAHGEHIR